MKLGKYLFCLIFSFFVSTTWSQSSNKSIDTLEFQMGYPFVHSTALEQLKVFPSARYKPNNDLIRLFNWMNPNYMAGGGEEHANAKVVVQEAVKIQEELITQWNYFLYIPNAGGATDSKNCSDKSTKMGSYIDLANRHPEIPLGLTTFWMQLAPDRLGYKQTKPNILSKELPSKFYIKDANGIVIKKALNFAAPDSLFIADGQMQKQCIQNILNVLTRPIDMINENGEEPPGVYGEDILKGDVDMLKDKDKLGISDWHIYISKKKEHMRQLYSSQFMTLPELKNTKFTVYCVEGGPIDRFDWQSTKNSCSAIKGNYYSTPDFYPRTPDNWKKWKGAWHGWKWINDGRKVEIKSGDRFFSPFVSAGWANNPENDIRPGQWLGLLKSLSVVGAEFYYVGYFNLKKPFTAPEDYVWQAAIPAYAQAVTSRFSDIFRNGNVLFDKSGEPIITYPLADGKDEQVLITVRKHNQKEQYIICATIQPFSNTEKTVLKKNITINVAGENYIIEARRQGSVYFLDRSSKPYVFYQLDRWHQYEHPMNWRKEIVLEAELADTTSSTPILHSTYVEKSNNIDFSTSSTSCILTKNQWLGYVISKRDIEHLIGDVYLHIYAKGNKETSCTLQIASQQYAFKPIANEQWEWITIKMDRVLFLKNPNTLIRIQSTDASLELDKMYISNSSMDSDLREY